MKITFSQKEIIDHLRSKVSEAFPGVRLFVQYDHKPDSGFEVEFSTEDPHEEFRVENSKLPSLQDLMVQIAKLP